MKTPSLFALVSIIGLPLLSAAKREADGVNVARYFAVEVDGQSAGFTQNVSGGTVKGELIETEVPAGHTIRTEKQVGEIIVEPLTLNIGMRQTEPLLDWIKASFDYPAATRDLTVISDVPFGPFTRRELGDALISSVSFPAMDGSSKDPCYMTVNIDPTTIQFEPGRAANQRAARRAARAQQKKWLCSNFKFELGDLPGDRVAKIDSFTWKQDVVRDELGDFREPTKVEIPNLKITISMDDVEAWADWYRCFVIDGQCTDADELSGSITFLAPDQSEELGSIDLDHVGIISLEQEASEANKDSASRFVVELYVEEMRFEAVAN